MRAPRDCSPRMPRRPNMYPWHVTKPQVMDLWLLVTMLGAGLQPIQAHDEPTSGLEGALRRRVAALASDHLPSVPWIPMGSTEAGAEPPVCLGPMRRGSPEACGSVHPRVPEGTKNVLCDGAGACQACWGSQPTGHPGSIFQAPLICSPRPAAWGLIQLYRLSNGS